MKTSRICIQNKILLLLLLLLLSLLLLLLLSQGEEEENSTFLPDKYANEKVNDSVNVHYSLKYVQF